jgi:hypothetical protein
MQTLAAGLLARRALLSLVFVIMTACGGGGGDGGAVSNGGSSGSAGAGATGSTPPPPPTPSPALSISQSTVSVNGQTGNAAPSAVSIPFSVANAPTSTLYANVTLSGDSVAGASASLQSSGSGTLIIAFAPPAQLGAGNYTENVALDVCTDSACAHPISGAPVTISVTYAVTGSPLPPVSFYFPQPITYFQATTSAMSPETANFQFNIQNVPPAGLYVLISQPKGGFITNVTDTVSPDTSGQLDVTLNFTLASPASLGSGYFKSSISVAICYDSACTHGVAGSPITVPVQYEVFLTQGKEYTLASSSQGGVSDLAYDAINQQLYVTSLAGYSGGAPGTVSQIDPGHGPHGCPGIAQRRSRNNRGLRRWAAALCGIQNKHLHLSVDAPRFAVGYHDPLGFREHTARPGSEYRRADGGTARRGTHAGCRSHSSRQHRLARDSPVR